MASEQGFDDIYLDIDPDRGLAPGERWQEALKAAADRCEAVLFLVSPAWLVSRWCLAEFLLAKSLHKCIFGLAIEPVPVERLPTEMTAEWQLCELVGEDRFRTFDVEIGPRRETVAFREAGLDLLRRGLQRAGLNALSFPWPPLDERNRAPYRGLRALDAQDAAIYFGRDAAIVRGLDRIRGMVERGVEKFLVVLGASGSGKSSFLRARIMAAAGTRRRDLPADAGDPSETAVISGNSAWQLRSRLHSSARRPRPPGRIKEVLAHGADGFGRLLRRVVGGAKRRFVGLDQARPDPTIVLCIDQAEELFNADGAAEAATFIARDRRAAPPAARRRAIPVMPPCAPTATSFCRRSCISRP